MASFISHKNAFEDVIIEVIIYYDALSFPVPTYVLHNIAMINSVMNYRSYKNIKLLIVATVST